MRNMRKKFSKLVASVLAVSLALGLCPVTDQLFTSEVKAAENEMTVVREWNFDDGLDGWSYDYNWGWEYSAGTSTSVSSNKDQMRFNVDYTKDQNKTWSQSSVVWHAQNGSGITLTGECSVTMDFFYCKTKKTKGDFKIQVYINDDMKKDVLVDSSAGQEVFDGLTENSLEIPLPAPSGGTINVDQIAIQLIGVQTDYNGSVWFDNIVIKKPTQSSGGDSQLQEKVKWAFEDGTTQNCTVKKLMNNHKG